MRAPEHDWSSHCADSFGPMAIAYEEPSRTKAFNRDEAPSEFACALARKEPEEH